VSKILTNKDLLRKIEAYILPAVVVMVGLAAFGLGRLSAVGEGPVSAVDTTLPQQSTEQQKYVASKSGANYYLPTCGGVAKIKEENRVWFATVAEAQAAGYTAAINCPGL